MKSEVTLLCLCFIIFILGFSMLAYADDNSTNQTCVQEGGSIPVIPNPLSCCEGLTLIKPEAEGLVGIFGYCTAKCGDGICDSNIESNYNCPIDCKEEGKNCKEKGGYCTDWQDKCKEGYNDGGPMDCPLGKSAQCCIKSSVPVCTDSDGGINYYVKGTVSGYNEDAPIREITTVSDTCNGDTLYEWACKNFEEYDDESYACQNGCKDGACIKGEEIKEQIKCIFKNSDKEEKCYTAEQNSRAYCSGVGTCAAEIKGQKGEAITWKSSCGGYQYTIIDGNDEKISFDCKVGETTTEEIKNKGFRFAYWQCYDGEEQKLGDETSCKLSETWQEYAKKFCEEKCTTVGQGKCKGNEKCEVKCGVNSFSVWNECYYEETNIIINNITVPTETTSNATEISSEEFLICKDSCPLDGKCYPMGYRKQENYCSDVGKFIEQLKADEKCDNSFECQSNVCVNGKCVSGGLIQMIIEWFKKLFGG